MTLLDGLSFDGSRALIAEHGPFIEVKKLIKAECRRLVIEQA